MGRGVAGGPFQRQPRAHRQRNDSLGVAADGRRVRLAARERGRRERRRAVEEQTPRHPHVYTNGDICLNLLGNGRRPTITVAQLSFSILSMLSSAKTKGIPQDNAVHAASAPGKPQEGWMYHDDSC